MIAGMYKSLKEDGFTKELLRLPLVNILPLIIGYGSVDTKKAKKHPNEASNQEYGGNGNIYYKQDTVVHKGP